VIKKEGDRGHFYFKYEPETEYIGLM
jgi:hypothetical protein